MIYIQWDLGCGKRPRGNVNITLINNQSVESIDYLDSYLEPYGFIYSKDNIVQLIDLNSTDFTHYLQDNKSEEDRFLMAHVIEHVNYPYQLLELIYPCMLILVAPNCYHSNVDSIDKEHIWSFNEYTLYNLLKRIGYNIINIQKIDNNEDLLAIATTLDVY